MKYTILGFQQEKLIKNDLSVEDAFILRTIKDMYSSSTMEFKDFEGIKYMWINYTYFLEQVPILGSKRNLMRKIEKYGKELLLLRVLENERNGIKGNYSFISPTAKLDELQDFDLMTESHKGYDKSVVRVMTKTHNKDTSIKDTSIKDNKDIYTDIFEHYNSLNLIKHRSFVPAFKTAINKAIKENKYTLEQMKQLLDRHDIAVKVTKGTQYEVKARGLGEFFGQKVFQSTMLICTEYEDRGNKEKYFNKTESKGNKVDIKDTAKIINAIDPSMKDWE